MGNRLRAIQRRFETDLPLFALGNEGGVVLEIKPYLQPFEVRLAQLEAERLLGTQIRVEAGLGMCGAGTAADVETLRERLTYWQRVGSDRLVPTRQVLFEASQGGSEELEHRSSLHTARRLRYGPHDLHEYRGKFFPQLVRSLLNIAGACPGDTVFDPMCGSGTTLCEAVASGMNTVGSDLNPLSVLIARTKTLVVGLSPSEFRRKMREYRDSFKFGVAAPELVWPADDLAYLQGWFDPFALNDIAAILAGVRRVRSQPYKDLLLVCLSNIIRAVSWQRLEDLRVRKEVREYARGDAQARFLTELDSQVDRIGCYLEMREGAKCGRLKGIFNVDAVAMGPELRNLAGTVDVLITSPPYATALPYLDTDRLSLVALGLLPRSRHRGTEANMVGTREITEAQRRELWTSYMARREELPGEVTSLIDRVAEHNHGEGVGFRRRNLPALLGKYYLAMLDAMRSARQMCRQGGRAFYVVGNNSTELSGQRIDIPTDRFLFEIGRLAGWRQRDFIAMELLVSRDIFKENRGSSESILCFEAA